MRYDCGLRVSYVNKIIKKKNSQLWFAKIAAYNNYTITRRSTLAVLFTVNK